MIEKKVKRKKNVEKINIQSAKYYHHAVFDVLESFKSRPGLFKQPGFQSSISTVWIRIHRLLKRMRNPASVPEKKNGENMYNFYLACLPLIRKTKGVSFILTSLKLMQCVPGNVHMVPFFSKIYANKSNSNFTIVLLK